MSDILIAPNGNNANKEVSILLAHQTFVDMVLNFLGKKERLNYRIKNNFILRLNDIEQFHYLLETKIAKEQPVHINHFSVTISYHDGTAREINGIKALNGFIETRDVIPRSVTLSWNVVVNFPTSTSIENQKIDLSFITNRKAEAPGNIILTINYTNQAWGTEVLNLLKDKIREVLWIDTSHAIAVSIKKRLIDIGIGFVAIAFIISTIIASILPQDNKTPNPSIHDATEETYFELAKSIAENKNEHDNSLVRFSLTYLSDEHIKSIAKNHIIDTKTQTALIAFASAREESFKKEQHEKTVKTLARLKFIGAILALWFAIYFYLYQYIKHHKTKSYILLNKRSEKEYDTDRANQSKLEYYSITSACIAVILGVIGNFVYQLLTQ